MLNTLLALTKEQEAYFDKKIGLLEAAIDALIGFVVVFVGIAVLVGILVLVGYIMKRTTKPATPNKPTVSAPVAPAPVAANTVSDEVDEETLAVITAALMAYYAQEKPQCEFTVKRIKRI